MSYINDALNKVQKEKDSPYVSYGGIVSAAGEKSGAKRTRLLATGLILVFFIAAGIGAWLYWTNVRKTPREVAMVQSPVVTTVQPARGLPAILVPLIPVPEPVVSAEVAVPLSGEVEKKPGEDIAPNSGVDEEKQIAVMPGNRMKQESSFREAPATVKSLYAQALQKQRDGRLEEARVLYEKVIRKEPHHIQALNNLGVVDLKMKRYKRAITRFKDALNINHNYVDAHYNLACLYAQKSDTKQSLFYLKNAIDINPEARLWASQDNDFKNLADLPEFGIIMQARDK